MPRQYSRSRRVEELVQRELARLIQKELSDAHLGLITISAVNISPDLKNAKIYITSIGDGIDVDQIIKTLNEISGHFRHELSKILTLRVVPRLVFEFDSSIERARRLTALIDSLHHPDQNGSK